MTDPSIHQQLNILCETSQDAQKILLSLSHAFHNKEPKPGARNPHAAGYVASAVTAAALTRHVLAGGTFAPATFADNYRKNANWQQAQLVALDFDDAVSVADLLAVPLLAAHALLIYATPSSTPDAPRARALLMLAEPVTERRRYEALAEALARDVAAQLGRAVDPGTWEGARKFAGSTNRAQAPHINQDAPPLALATVAAMIDQDAAAAEMDKALATVAAPDLPAVPLTSGRAERYARAAIEATIADYLSTPAGVGMRHKAFVAFAARMIGFQYGRWPGAEQAESIIRGAGESTDRTRREIEDAIGWAYQNAESVELRLADNDAAPSWPPAPSRRAGAPSAQRMSARYFTELKIPDSDVLLIGDMGTGKTTYAARSAAGGPLLAITHRTALARGLSEALDCEVYSGLTADQLRQINRLTITANSMYKLIGPDGPSFTPGSYTLFLDEIRQLLAHLTGETFRGPEADRAWSAFGVLVRGAGRVIAADAHADKFTLQLLEQIRGAPLTVIENTYTRARSPLTVYQHRERAIDQIWRLVADDAGPVAVPTSSRKLAQTIEQLAIERYGESAVLCINGDNSTDPDIAPLIFQLSRKGPTQDALINSYRVLIYTPTLGSGIDIQTPVHAQVGIFYDEPLAATDIHQMLNRCRNVGQTYVYIRTRCRALETDADGIARHLWENAVQTARVAEFDRHGVPVATDAQRALLRLKAGIDAADNASKNRLLADFLALAHGYESTSYNAERADDERARILDAQQAIAEATRRYVMNATPVTGDEYRAHQDNGTLSASIRHGFQRWRIERAAGGQQITERFYDLLHAPEQRARLYRLMDVMLAHAGELAELDRIDAGAPLHQRKHRARQRALLLDLLRRVFGRNRLLHADEMSAEHITEAVGDFIAASGDEARRLFGRRADLSNEPVAFLRWVMSSMLGLQLKSRKRGRAQRRVYHLDAPHLDEWLDLALAARSQFLAEQAERAAVGGGIQNLDDGLKPVTRILHHIAPPAGFRPSRHYAPPAGAATSAAPAPAPAFRGL